MKKCPECKLINPDDALRCDCGHDLTAESNYESGSTSEVVNEESPKQEKKLEHNDYSIEKIKSYSYGQMLLRAREYLFDKIYEEQNLDEQIKYFSLYSFLFSAIYGLFLGTYAGGIQILTTTLKVPLLLFGTLVICLPALFTFNVLLGSKLSFKQTLTMLTVTTYLISIILVSLAPIMLFFIVSTQSKNFIVFLNVIVFSISGGFGVSLLWQGMRYLTQKAGYQPNIQIIQVWSVIYMFVGTQFAWILRPFIGEKGTFALFRHLEGNFYLAVINLIASFFK